MFTRNGARWTEEEDLSFEQAYEFFVNKLALIHKRSIKAIIYRLENYSNPVKQYGEPITKEIGTMTE
jgi:hypothetical protein